MTHIAGSRTIRPLMRIRPARIHFWLVPREAMPSLESSRSTVRRLEDIEAFCVILNPIYPESWPVDPDSSTGCDRLIRGRWDDPNCAHRATLILLTNPSKLACSLLKGSLVDPRLRASNEHILIVRVPRAGGRPGYPAPFFSILF